MSSYFKAIVIGTSTGGLSALPAVLSPLMEDFPLTILIVQHLSAHSDDFMVRHLREFCDLEVLGAEDKMDTRAGCIYIAPPNYHLMVEEEGTLALSISPPVHFSRPSIDVLFETAADAWQEQLIGIILTGANSDGTSGVKKIKERGGHVLVQDIATAEAETMPASASEFADMILPLDQIGNYLNNLVQNKTS
jgi:two-component system chemotaxis response regulator CheB